MAIYEWVSPLYAALAQELGKHMGWYAVALVFALINEAAAWGFKKLSKRETDKKAKILLRMQEEGALFSATELLSSREQGEAFEAKRKKAVEIAEAHKGRPYIIFFAFFLRFYVFLSMILFFAGKGEIKFVWFFPVVSVILSVSAFVTRKTAILWIFMSALVYYGYSNLSGTANVFYIYFAAFALFKRVAKSALGGEPKAESESPAEGGAEKK